MENNDLNKVMAHYRKEARKVVIQYNARKIGAMIIALIACFAALQLKWLWVFTIVFGTYLALYFYGYFRQPAILMNDAFYLELAKLDLQDQDALSNLKSNLKAKAYLFLDEVEDFIDAEIKTRALNKELASKGAQELLNKE